MYLPGIKEDAMTKKEDGSSILTNLTAEFENTAFVTSPTGEKASEVYNHFREILDFIIKPAVEACGNKLQVNLSLPQA
jgi:hypothetical protein